METWIEKICGRDVKFGLRTERDDENIYNRTCPPGAIVTMCFRPYGYKAPGFESVRFNTLTDDTTKEEVLAGLIQRHGTHGVFYGFVDEF